MAKDKSEIINKSDTDIDERSYSGLLDDASNLYKFTQFYKFFPEIFHTVSGKINDKNLDSVCPKSHGLLSWSHFYLQQAEKNKKK